MLPEFAPHLTGFRAEVRGWLAANNPGPEPPDEDEAFQFRRAWQRRLDDAGWLGLTWPVEYGGRGLGVLELSVFSEELARSGAPRPANLIGLEMSGPTILSHGTHEQKERLLPPLLSGEEIWCQGFSEPDFGSDLASLRTRAVRTDDGWSITGQKVWTSFAHEAKWCQLLVRTDPDASKYAGLSCFLIDMDQPGVTVRRIRQITGDAEYNEVTFDGAVATGDQLLERPGDGWTVAVTTLMHERANLAIALAVDAQEALNDLIQLVRSRPRGGSQIVRDRLAQLAIESLVLRSTSIRIVLAQANGHGPGAESALSKWRWAELNQGISELALEVLGLEEHAEWQKRFLRTRANTIEGGTADILKNVVAERVLGLPKAR